MIILELHNAYTLNKQLINVVAAASSLVKLRRENKLNKA